MLVCVAWYEIVLRSAEPGPIEAPATSGGKMHGVEREDGWELVCRLPQQLSFDDGLDPRLAAGGAR